MVCVDVKHHVYLLSMASCTLRVCYLGHRWFCLFCCFVVVSCFLLLGGGGGGGGGAVELRAWFHDALWSDTPSSRDLESVVHFTE